MTIGERIRKARKAKRMTQQQLADAVGCTRKTISMYESEKRLGESFYTIARICKALSVSADWLLGLECERECEQCMTQSS